MNLQEGNIWCSTFQNLFDYGLLFLRASHGNNDPWDTLWETLRGHFIICKILLQMIKFIK